MFSIMTLCWQLWNYNCNNKVKPLTPCWHFPIKTLNVIYIIYEAMQSTWQDKLFRKPKLCTYKHMKEGAKLEKYFYLP